MKTLYRNHEHTLCHPEAPAEGSCHTSSITFKILRDKSLRMTVCLSSSVLTAAVLTCLLLSLPTQAKWGDNCTLNGGTIIKANEYGNDKGGYCNDPTNDEITEKDNCNGMEFCMSNNVMNWWSAFTWCESIGGQHATFAHMCPTTKPYQNRTTRGYCANLTTLSETNYFVWSSMGEGKAKAFDVELETGYVGNDGAYRNSKYQLFHAFCEEKK